MSNAALQATAPERRDASNSVVARLAERYEVSPVDFLNTVKATVMPNANVSNEQLVAFLLVADKYQLNPLVKEIYAFPSKGGIQPIVGIDGWYTLMNRHPQFDGIAFEDVLSDDGEVVAITAKVYRKDRKHPVEATEYMAECKGSTQPWKQWPRRMLRHKAAIQGARAAFGLAGIYDPDEGERIVEAQATVSAPPTKAKGLAAVRERLDAQDAEQEAAPADEPEDGDGEQQSLTEEFDAAFGKDRDA